MIDIDGQKFNLNLLLNFEILKQVLQTLNKKSANFKLEIDNIIVQMKEKDKTINSLKDKLEKNVTNNNKKIISLEKQIEKLTKALYNKEKDDNNIDEENSELNDNTQNLNQIQNEVSNTNIEEILLIPSYNNNILKDNYNNNNNQKITDRKEKDSKLKDLLNLLKTENGTKECIELTFNEIKDCQDKIEQIEKNSLLTINANKNMIYLENSLKQRIINLETIGKENFNQLRQADTEMEKKVEKFKSKLDELLVKFPDFSIFDMIKDKGEGPIDTSKMLLIALEQKIDKKFELIDEETKAIKDEILKIKQNYDENKNKIYDLENAHNNLQDELNKGKDTPVNNQQFKEEIERQSKIIKEDNNDLNHKYMKLKEELQKVIKDKEIEIFEKINKLKEEINTIASFNFNSSCGTIDKNVNNFIFKKINDLDNDLSKSIKNLPIEDIQSKINQLTMELQNKITQNDLQELYNFYLKDAELLKELKDNIQITYEDSKNAHVAIESLSKRVDSLFINQDIFVEKKTQREDPPIIDTTKLIDNVKFNESIRAIYREIEKLKSEEEDARRKIKDIIEKLKEVPQNSNIENIKNTIINIISELKGNMNKKFIEKHEVSKMVKLLETQIKSLEEDSKKNEGENWLLAKRQINPYKCASCEAKLDNLNKSNEYLAWNKYPVREEKGYRLGSGFSHILQMISNEMLLKNIKDINSDNEDKKKFSAIKNAIQSGKVRLPKVKIQKKTIEYSDEIPSYSSDGEDDLQDSNEKVLKPSPTAPKIMRILKKKKKSVNKFE